MNSSDDNMVVIRHGQHQGDPSVISINCLDQPGLACDLARVLFEFSLNVVKGDLSKDGQWCLVIFWVTPSDQTFQSTKWATLTKHLVSACPSTRSRLLIPLLSEPKPNKGLYILQTWSSDHLGLLNDIASFLWDLEMVVHKMKATTSPENRAVNIFYITDIREMLHEKQRQELLCNGLKSVLGDGSVSCKVMAAGPEWGGLECSSLSIPPPFASTFYLDGKNGDLEPNFVKANGRTGSSQSTFVTLDNSLSPAHSLLQISCKDRRGLFYDCMRTLRDFQVQVAFGRLSTDPKGGGDIDLFILEADGSKILDPERQKLLSCRLEVEIMQPVNVLTQSRGPDTELLVAAPIEQNGRGRPKVLFDTTLLFRKLGFGIFQADFGRCIISDRNWEVYRFLFTERPDFSSPSDKLRSRISEQTKKALIT